MFDKFPSDQNAKKNRDVRETAQPLRFREKRISCLTVYLLLVLVPFLVLGGEVRPAPSLSAASASGSVLISPLAVVRQGTRVVQLWTAGILS
jgi:hypothetical protein